LVSDANAILLVLTLLTHLLPGYGYENTSYYTNSTIQFCNVGNIHAVRDSYQKLCSVCNSDSTNDVNFHSLIEDTKWLSHVRTILAASWEAAYWVHVWRMPILLHCSHGWDRTSQVSALAQLLLDPYYRTRQGFSVLVEKDFMSFGHPFHLRSAHGEGRSQTATTPQSNDEGQISPIFLQFLDCVFQMVQLYPEGFEFNTQYLLELSFHIYSCRFGTMLCDTEREREDLAGIRLRTYSLWDYLDSKPECKNDSFEQGGDVLLMPLPTLLRNVRLWTERHCCFSRKPTIRSLPDDATKSLMEQSSSS
jgi:myotubularin-related protein 1/2